jgi:hypothetical protein
MRETEKSFEIDIEIQCTSCDGTGLYIGMAEKDGAAVICSTCKGTGKSTFKRTFAKYHGRVRRDDVDRVYQTAGGYVIGSKNFETPDKKTIRFAESGVAYEEWFRGAKPLPIEDLHCPYQHTHQEMRSSDHPANALYKRRCDAVLTLGGTISSCKLRRDMTRCWDLYKELVGQVQEDRSRVAARAVLEAAQKKPINLIALAKQAMEVN